jgi:Zn-dependent protease with chaperone function
MNKTVKTLLILGVGGFAATLVMYWFNLDNKMIYYGVRPLLNKLYDKQKRDVKI